MPSTKQVLTCREIYFVGAFCERPRANAVRPYDKKDRDFTISVLFSRLACRDLCQLNRNALSLTRLRRDADAPSPLSALQTSPHTVGSHPPGGSLWFVRPECPSAFPDKHCFCGRKSDHIWIFCFIFSISSLNPSRKPYQLSFTL